MAETLPGFDIVTWLGLMAPAGTPSAIIARMNREITAALEGEDARRQIMQGGLEIAPASAEAFGETIRRDYAKYGQIIRETGIRAE